MAGCGQESGQGTVSVEKLRSRYEGWLLDEELDEEAPV
jgi:hypothetical protein